MSEQLRVLPTVALRGITILPEVPDPAQIRRRSTAGWEKNGFQFLNFFLECGNV